jgi:HlyD family secretion protein
MVPTGLVRGRTLGRWRNLLLAGVLLATAGCGFPKAEAESTPQAGQGRGEETATVNVATAEAGNLGRSRQYTGTTQPFRLVSVRSQVEGQLLDMEVNVGDTVTQGQVLAQVDAAVLQASVAEAQAEVASRQAEVAQARAEVNDAQAQVASAQVELQQAQADLKRSQSLFQEGAIPEQQAEEARNQVAIAAQAVRSAQEQVRTQQQAVAAVQGRVEAQRAVVAGEQQRQSFSTLTSSIDGSVLERLTEPGNLVQPGTELLRLGDFSQVKVEVQISELELGNLRLGQPVQVSLDAFPNQSVLGRVTRISPAADPVARLVPIEVTIPNPDGRLGSGLLARVSLTASSGRSRIVIPETALKVDQEKRQGQRSSQGQAPQGQVPQGQQPSQVSGTARPGAGTQARRSGTVFVIAGSDEAPQVTARQVTLGDRNDGQVEVLSGLQAGDRFVTLSSKALKNGDIVRPSILSSQP